MKNAPAGSAASRGPKWHWRVIALTLAIYGGFGLEYTEHIVRDGAGYWTPDAMAAALSHRPESTILLIFGTVWLVVLAMRTPLQSSPAAYLKRLFGLKIAPTLAFIVICRSYIVQPIIVPNDSAAPEIPQGSQILVWKYSSTFAPGDVIVYSNRGQTFLGRTVSTSDGVVTVNRNGQTDIAVQRLCIEGKVLCVYWRGASAAKAAENQPPPNSKQ